MIDNHLYPLIIKIFYTLFQFYEQEYWAHQQDWLFELTSLIFFFFYIYNYTIFNWLVEID